MLVLVNILRISRCIFKSSAKVAGLKDLTNSRRLPPNLNWGNDTDIFLDLCFGYFHKPLMLKSQALAGKIMCTVFQDQHIGHNFDKSLFRLYVIVAEMRNTLHSTFWKQ